jgi:hypothetical protein
VNTLIFDHRLAMVLSPQAALTFLGLLHSVSPEYRTTGDFREQLKICADKLSELAAAIRNTALARTIYTEADFSSPIDDFYVFDLPGLLGPVLRPDYTRVVGAMDLRNHNNAFFHDVPKAAGWSGIPLPGPTFRRGNLDFRWQPPARLVRRPLPALGVVHADGSPVLQYSITNPKECADAANQQSEQDYADLLVSSGYMTLVQLAAQLGHAATQPDHSETVRGDVMSLRHPQSETEVTVHTGPILLTGDIEAQGRRQPQKVRAFVSCTTQPVPRVRPLHYRVLIRTLSSVLWPRLWIPPTYDSIQTASYINDPRHRDDPLHTGLKRLTLQTFFGAWLDEAELIRGSSPLEALHAEGTLNLKAHTFDWWIPVKPHPGVSDAIALESHHQQVFGNPPGGHPGGVPKMFFLTQALLEKSITDASIVLGLGWEEGAQTWKGERRELVAESILQFHYKLDWVREHLRIVIENRPEDRNYVLFVVVEETFGSVEPDEQPPKVLHTAFPVPINGQLTYVPQSFFDQEKAARGKLEKIMSDLADHYAVSKQPGHGDPVFGPIRPGELTTEAGLERLAAAAREFEPALLDQMVRKHHGQL